MIGFGGAASESGEPIASRRSSVEHRTEEAPARRLPARRGVDPLAIGGLNALWLLALLFVGLKSSGLIAWSWWWVFSPIWLPLTIPLAWIVLFLGFAMIHASIQYLGRWRRESS